ncbi:MAG: hypothetical protein AB8G22_13270, partial [Saprospiraceae bacterium]
MKNRLHCAPQPCLLLGLFLVLFQAHLLAQNPQDDFIFTYNGADTLYVGDDCTVSLFDDDGSPNWITDGLTPTLELSDQAPAGAMLGTFFFIPDSTGFEMNDRIDANTTDSVRVVYSAQHDGGSSGTAVTAFFDFTVFIRDTLPPVFPNVDANITFSCVESVASETLTPVDNCDGPLSAVTSIDVITVPFDKCNEGEIVRSWTAMDSDGNTRIVRQTITILPDFTPPVFGTRALDLRENCDDPTFFGYDSWVQAERNRILADMSDACTVKDSIRLTDNAPDLGMAPCNQEVEVIFTLTDSCGNAARDTAIYMVTDTIAPVLTPASFDTLNLSCEATIPTAPTVIATDNCTAVPTVDFSETTNPPLDDMNNVCGNYNYTITRRWIAADNCDNRDTVIQIINIRDEDGPDFTLPIDVTIYECSVDLTDFTLTGSGSNAMDNCDPMPVISYTDDTTSMDCAFSFVVERSWIAQDACNNSTTKVQTITVQDTVAPTFIVPRDTMVDCRAADSLNVVGEPTMIMDNCDPLPMVSFIDVFGARGCANGDTIRRRWRAEDACGNVSFQTQLLFVRDEDAPDILTPAQNIVVDCADSLGIEESFTAWVNAH